MIVFGRIVLCGSSHVLCHRVNEDDKREWVLLYIPLPPCVCDLPWVFVVCIPSLIVMRSESCVNWLICIQLASADLEHLVRGLATRQQSDSSPRRLPIDEPTNTLFTVARMEIHERPCVHNSRQSDHGCWCCLC